MTIKEARWFVEQDVWRSIQEYRAFNNITKANILQQALNIILHSFPDESDEKTRGNKQKKFVLLKGKTKDDDEYFNPDNIRSFYIYEGDRGDKSLNIYALGNNRVRELPGREYDIDDFVERLMELEG